jgi:hypothetical protein
MNHVIVAPHPDDEIIGCFEVLQKEKNIIIIYSEDVERERREEAMKLKGHNDNITVQLFLHSIPMSMLNQEYKFYFPDPIYEIHPKHRELGMSGELYARNGFDVTFYNTTMNAPYIHEVSAPSLKQQLLDDVYPSQKDLWKYEHKYFLFEGYSKWIF